MSPTLCDKPDARYFNIFIPPQGLQSLQSASSSWVAELGLDQEPSDTKLTSNRPSWMHLSLCLSFSWTSGSHVYPDPASVKLMT